jgi:hypothetical protein
MTKDNIKKKSFADLLRGIGRTPSRLELALAAAAGLALGAHFARAQKQAAPPEKPAAAAKFDVQLKIQPDQCLALLEFPPDSSISFIKYDFNRSRAVYEFSEKGVKPRRMDINGLPARDSAMAEQVMYRLPRNCWDGNFRY